MSSHRNSEIIFLKTIQEQNSVSSAAAFLLRLLAAYQRFGVSERTCLDWDFIAQYLGLDGPSHVVEGLSDVGVGLCANLKERDPKLIGHGLAFFVGDLPVSIWHITFVPHQYLHYILVGVHFDLLEPVFHGMEGVNVTD